MSTTLHHGLRRAGILGRALAAVAVVAAVALTARDLAPLAAPQGWAVAVLPTVLVGWCLAGPFLIAAATRTPRSRQELMLVFALVGPGPVLLIAAAYGIWALGGLL